MLLGKPWNKLSLHSVLLLVTVKESEYKDWPLSLAYQMDALSNVSIDRYKLVRYVDFYIHQNELVLHVNFLGEKWDPFNWKSWNFLRWKISSGIF